MNNLMIDLETMGTRADAAIVSIGAQFFCPDTLELGDSFYRVVDLQSAVDQGASITPSTVMWWMQQSDQARHALQKDAEHIASVLLEFKSWCMNTCPPGDLMVWGNGAAFDNVILSSAYDRNQLSPPWKHWNDRCYRTLKNLYPAVQMAREGTHHNALDDARSQALHFLAIAKATASKPT